MPNLMPNGLVVLTQAHFEAQCGPLRIRYSLDRYVIAWGYISRLLDIALRKITAEHPLEAGTSSNAITTSTHGTPT